MESEIKISVVLLTGFLGAGKTTFLNHILGKNKDKRYAIIENEYGEQGVDNELIIRQSDSIVELNSGCLCCTLSDNLFDILNELYDRRNEFDEIIIEATGLADPSGLAQPFISHPLVKRHFPLTAIICIVDAELIEDQLDETEEALNQIAFSDILLINKVDLVSEQYVTDLCVRLQQINPLAKIYKGSKDQFPLIEFNKINKELAQILLSTKKEPNNNNLLNFPIQKPDSGHHHHHTTDIISHSFTFDEPFDLDKLRLRLSVYLTFQSKKLYRIKGLIWLAGADCQYILQSVGKRFDITEQKNKNSTEQKQSVLVFIGKNIQREGLEEMLYSCLSKT